MQVTIETSGSASVTLGKLIEGVTHRRPLNAALGKRGEVELREHFLDRNQEPNRSGFPKQDFWARIRTATALAAVDEAGATVAIADPAITQKIYGGEIRPKEGKYLTLAAIALAVGKSPRVFPNLEPLVRWKDGKRRAIALYLPDPVGTAAGKDKSGASLGGTVFYWLVLSVTQKKDPRALPPRAKFEAALLDEAGAFIGSDLLR
jgi:hypothetical protein